MPITSEKIQSMKAALESIDMSVYKLTDIFFMDFNNVDVTQNLLEQIQSYIIQMSMLIPEIRAYIKFMGSGVSHNDEHHIKRLDMMEEYIKVNKTYCEELLKELKM